MNRNSYEQISAAPRNDAVVAYKQFIRHVGWRVGGSVLCIKVNCWQPTDMKTRGNSNTTLQVPNTARHTQDIPAIEILWWKYSSCSLWRLSGKDGYICHNLHICLHSLLLLSIRLISQIVFCWYTPYLFIFYIFCWCVPCFSWLSYGTILMVIFIHIFLNNLK